MKYNAPCLISKVCLIVIVIFTVCNRFVKFCISVVLGNDAKVILQKVLELKFAYGHWPFDCVKSNDSIQQQQLLVRIAICLHHDFSFII